MFVYMRPFRPVNTVTPVYQRRLVITHDQGFWQLSFPSIGTLTWSQVGRCLAEYRVANMDRTFALIKPYPTFAFPVTVRDLGVRYQVTATPAPYAYAIPYVGQTLTPAAIFEVWSFAGASSANLSAITCQISPRDQQPVTPTTIAATGLKLSYHYYPVYYPIT